jgi:pyruvate,water dikinase
MPSPLSPPQYAHLVGGELYEPKEENPMLGWRGASRYHSPAFQAAFQLECEAIRQVRETMGRANVQSR